MKPAIHQLTYPVPRREPVELGNGKFCTQPWETSGCLSAILHGGKFVPGRHEFAPGVSEFAFQAQELHNQLITPNARVLP
jgi:hypothetical protein